MIAKISGTGCDKMLAELEAELSGERSGIEWPWHEMQKLFGKLRPGELTVLSGTEGSAKSYLALHLLLKCQAEGLNWYYMPLEETPEYWLRRMLAIMTNDWDIINLDRDTAQRKIGTYVEHGDTLKELSNRIFDNPRSVIDDNMGGKHMPDVAWRDMSDHIAEVVNFADILVIDPVTLVDFEIDGYDGNGRKIERHEMAGQRDFVRRLVASLAGTKCHVIVVTHSTKCGEHIQGHADWTRFSQNSLKLACHDQMDSEVMKIGGMENDDTVSHRRTLQIHKVRNAEGSRMGLALDLGRIGPDIQIHGVIKSQKKGKK